MSTPPLDANRPGPPDPGAGPRHPPRPGLARRLGRAWRALAADQRLAAGTALGLFACLFLPWYSTSPTVVGAHKQAASASHSGLWAFGWVEAAVLLVAVGVLFLLYGRAERRAFHLPGGDGGVIVAAGAWVAFLVIWRFFDRPDVGTGVAVGLQWGIFVTLAVGVLLAYAGTRIRARQQPGPPVERPVEPRGAAPPGSVSTRPLADAPAPRPEDATGATRVHRGEPAPEDPTTALPRRRGET